MKHLIWYLIGFLAIIVIVSNPVLPARTISIQGHPEVLPQLQTAKAAQEPVLSQPEGVIGTATSTDKPWLSSSSILKYVYKRSLQLGVSPASSTYVLKHESQYCGWNRDGKYEPNLPGDDGKSIGCWQIYIAMHPDVTPQCAGDFYCSTDWSLRQMAAGRIDWWSAWRYRCKPFYTIGGGYVGGYTDNPPGCQGS